MNTRTLLGRLMAIYGDNPNSLAMKLQAKGVKQPQIYKFHTGQTKEPRRSTLTPVADFYKVPIEAFFNEELAGELLAKLESGWLPKPQWRTAAPLQPQVATVQEPSPPVPSTCTVSIEQAFEALAMHLAHLDATSRKQAAFQLASLADSPADHAKLAALFTVATTPGKQIRA